MSCSGAPGLQDDQVADGLGVDRATVRRWCEGTETPPYHVVAALRRLAAVQERLRFAYGLGEWGLAEINVDDRSHLRAAHMLRCSRLCGLSNRVLGGDAFPEVLASPEVN